MRPENYQAISQPPSNEYELNFGPNHPGIEGNYALRLKLNGDEVVEARADAGYLHRGFEKLMEGRLWIQNIALVPRICVPDPVPMEVCYSLAIEELCGLQAPVRAQWIRVLQLEMSRLAAHLFAFGGHAATTGMYTPMFWGVADRDLVTASLEGHATAAGLGTFFVERDAPGVSEREHWDAIGMRGTATHGIVLQEVFVAEWNALAIPGAFTRCMQMSRGSFVGNQVAGIACYLGAAHSLYRYTIGQLRSKKFADSDRPLGTAPYQQELIGHMLVDLETATIWLRRQIELESSATPLLPKDEVVKRWRLCKGVVAEAAFRLGTYCVKASGTGGGTGNHGVPARSLRDLCMGLVQAFPAERGRLMAAQMEIEGDEQAQFGTG